MGFNLAFKGLIWFRMAKSVGCLRGGIRGFASRNMLGISLTAYDSVDRFSRTLSAASFGDIRRPYFLTFRNQLRKRGIRVKCQAGVLL